MIAKEFKEEQVKKKVAGNWKISNQDCVLFSYSNYLERQREEKGSVTYSGFWGFFITPVPWRTSLGTGQGSRFNEIWKVQTLFSLFRTIKGTRWIQATIGKVIVDLHDVRLRRIVPRKYNLFTSKCDSFIVDIKEKNQIVYRIRTGAPRMKELERRNTNAGAQIYFLRCDFRILFLITANALNQETRTRVTKSLFFYSLHKCFCWLRKYRLL